MLNFWWWSLYRMYSIVYMLFMLKSLYNFNNFFLRVVSHTTWTCLRFFLRPYNSWNVDTVVLVIKGQAQLLKLYPKHSSMSNSRHYHLDHSDHVRFRRETWRGFDRVQESKMISLWCHYNILARSLSREENSITIW